MSNAQLYKRMTDYLAKFYDAAFYQRAGVRYPVLVYPPAPEQVHDVDSLLGTLSAATPDHFVIYDHAYLHTLQNSARHLYNGITYTLDYLELYPLRLHAAHGRYFDTLATCFALEHELRAAAQANTMRLPLRTQYHRVVSPTRSLWHGRGRSATIGVACVTAFKSARGYEALLARRSAHSATDPRFFHVLPAFVFQPISTSPTAYDWCVSHHIYREWLEELFSVDEAQLHAPEAVYAHPAMQDLQAMLACGAAELRLTGVTLNTLTLRAEISVLLLIHDATWWARCYDPASPYRMNAHAETLDGRIVRVPLGSDADVVGALPADFHTIMPPQAAVALWLARDALA